MSRSYGSSRVRLVGPLVVAALACAMVGEPATVWAEDPTPAEPTFSAEAIEHFERQVRPLLAERCQQCHGADVQEAGLRFDSRTAVLRGGESGPLVDVAEPARSRLLAVVGYEADVQMPPDAKLPAAAIEALAAWIANGLPWPGGDAVPDAGAPGESGPSDDAATVAAEPRSRYEATRRAHWALQPIARPPLPAVNNGSWSSGAIDRFVLARLEAAGLEPSPPADRRTLLRRLSFDLVGLPPTADEIAAFEHDASPDAVARVVDRLLASPHYGERWGRHWLDVARYADTKGYVFTQEPKYPYSYTYRDYVIRALNDDVPFDRFVLEQIAADHLPETRDDPRALAALGFLTLGRRFNNNIHDIIDDRIDVVTRGLLGLTVTCARCHDHKYDPVPIEDYYSLYGVFASSTEPEDLPLIVMPEESAAYEAHQRDLAARQAEFDAYVAAQSARIEGELRSHVGSYLARLVSDEPDALADLDAFVSLDPGDVKPQVVRRWRRYVHRTAGPDDPVFGPWHLLAALPAESFADDAAALVASWSAPFNPLVVEALAAEQLTSMFDVASLYARLLSDVDARWQSTVATDAALEALPDAAAEQLRQVLYGEKAPIRVDGSDMPDILDRAARGEWVRLQGQVETLRANSPAEPARAQVLVDQPQPHEPRVFLRGSPHRHGDAVPRQWLAVLSAGERQPFSSGSGRLEMARAIVAPDNPLTSRVIVNRLWQHHFGVGLVVSSSDFGTRSTPPSHPDLLDYLASELVGQGWSLKALHRAIVLSSTYQQASDWRAEGAAVDAENRLLWRMNRRRLEFEPLRDAMLAAADQLDPALGGRPVNLFGEGASRRRSVYGFVDRQDLPGVLRAFDFASPDASAGERPRTTVPQQALFLMNAPLVHQQAATLAERSAREAEAALQRGNKSVAHHPGDAAAARVAALYRLALGRTASDTELRLALDYIARHEPAAAEPAEATSTDGGGGAPNGDSSETAAEATAANIGPWTQLAQVLLLSNEFAFVD